MVRPPPRLWYSHKETLWPFKYLEFDFQLYIFFSGMKNFRMLDYWIAYHEYLSIYFDGR